MSIAEPPPSRLASMNNVARKHADAETELNTVPVALGDRSYNILIGSDWADNLGRAFQHTQAQPRPNAMVFTSPVIGELHYHTFEQSLSRAGFTSIARHDIPDGEKHKTIAEYENGLSAIVAKFRNEDVKPVVFNLGGGIVGDVGGFIAGSYQRGNVHYVQVPTTLLACVDCSVGGKVGVNLRDPKSQVLVKNQVGLFYQPSMVLIELAFLDTLPDDEMRSGLAEVIKYGAVCARDVFETLEAEVESVLRHEKYVLCRLVKRCCEIKAEIVARDERDESGDRMRLNFGHTIGHAIESTSESASDSDSSFGFRHGEAVAIGMLAATRLAIEIQACDESFYTRLLTLIERIGLPTTAAGKNLDVERVLGALARDKKFVRGENRFVLPTGLGESRIEKGIDISLVKRIIASYL